MLTVGLVDDDPFARHSITKILEDQGAEIAFVSSDGKKALETYQDLLRQGKPIHAVAVDLQMPGISGIQVITELHKLDSTLALMVLSGDPSPQSIKKAFAAGARGFIYKEDASKMLLSGIKAIRQGQTVFSPTLEPSIKALLTTRIPDSQTANQNYHLSDSELKVLSLLVESYDNRQIGRKLGISLDTVKKHISSILAKMEVPDRTGAAVAALRSGLIT